MPDHFSDYPLSPNQLRNVRTTVLQKIRLTCAQHFTHEFLRNTSIDFLEVAMADAFRAHLTAFCLGLGEDRVTAEWPTDWWEAFKLRWFPTFTRWGVLRPVRMHRIDEPVYAAVCPHHSPLEQGAQMHIAWLLEQDGFPSE